MQAFKTDIFDWYLYNQAHAIEVHLRGAGWDYLFTSCVKKISEATVQRQVIKAAVVPHL